jgi:hypothetical protein
MIPSKNSAFKPWKPLEICEENNLKRDKSNQPAELMRKYAKRLYLVFKSKNIYPSIQGKKIIYTYEKNKVSKFTREELYLFIKSVFGKEALVEKPNWEALWAVFRRKFLKNPYIGTVPVDKLFIKTGSNLCLNRIYW